MASSIKSLAEGMLTKTFGERVAPQRGPLSKQEQLAIYQRITPAGLAQLMQQHGEEAVRRYVKEMDGLAAGTGIFDEDPLWRIS